MLVKRTYLIKIPLCESLLATIIAGDKGLAGSLHETGGQGRRDTYVRVAVG